MSNNTRSVGRGATSYSGPSTPSYISASALARNPGLFLEWADLVHLDIDTRSEIPNDGVTRPIHEALERAKAIPSWLSNPSSTELAFASIAFGEEVQKLCDGIEHDSRLPPEDRRFKSYDHVDQELHGATPDILKVCKITKQRLQAMSDLPPNAAELRTCVDGLMEYAYHVQGMTISHMSERPLKLPQAGVPRIAVASVKPAAIDVMVFSDLPGYDLGSGSAISSFYQSRNPSDLLVVHCITEYKSESDGRNQTLMGMVSGLHQRLALGFDKHFVFGIIHSHGRVFQVVAGMWQGKKIIVYELNYFNLGIPIGVLQFYLLIREIRRIGLEYHAEIKTAGESRFSSRASMVPLQPWEPYRLDGSSQHSETALGSIHEADEEHGNENAGDGSVREENSGYDHERISSYLESLVCAVGIYEHDPNSGDLDQPSNDPLVDGADLDPNKLSY